jgi:hypothetical protein
MSFGALGEFMFQLRDSTAVFLNPAKQFIFALICGLHGKTPH